MDVYSWDFNMFDYGSQLRRCHRLFHEFLGASAVSRFDNYLNKHTCRFLSRLAETPDDFLGHVKLSVLLCLVVIVCPALTFDPSVTGALIMEMTYGMEIESYEDKFLQATERVVELIGGAIEPGAFLVDTFPICLSPNSGFP